MSKLPHPETKPSDKKHKINTTDNGKLTDKHLKCGSLKGRVAHYSQTLRCWFYLKPGVSFAEIEQIYLEAQQQYSAKLKNTIKGEKEAVTDTFTLSVIVNTTEA